MSKRSGNRKVIKLKKRTGEAEELAKPNNLNKMINPPNPQIVYSQLIQTV